MYILIQLFCLFRHYPKTSFTIVTDTPENLRLKQQSMLNSQVSSSETLPDPRICLSNRLQRDYFKRKVNQKRFM